MLGVTQEPWQHIHKHFPTAQAYCLAMRNPSNVLGPSIQF